METNAVHIRRLFFTLWLVQRVRTHPHRLERYILRDAWQTAVLDAVGAAIVHANPASIREGLHGVWMCCRIVSDVSVSGEEVVCLTSVEHDLSNYTGARSSDLDTLLRRMAASVGLVVERCSSLATRHRVAWMCRIDTSVRAVRVLERHLCSACVRCVCVKRRLGALRDALVDHSLGRLAPPRRPSGYSPTERDAHLRARQLLSDPVCVDWVSVRGCLVSVSALTVQLVRRMTPLERYRLMDVLRTIVHRQQRLGPLRVDHISLGLHSS